MVKYLISQDRQFNKTRIPQQGSQKKKPQSEKISSYFNQEATVHKNTSSNVIKNIDLIRPYPSKAKSIPKPYAFPHLPYRPSPTNPSLRSAIRAKVDKRPKDFILRHVRRDKVGRPDRCSLQFFPKCLDATGLIQVLHCHHKRL